MLPESLLNWSASARALRCLLAGDFETARLQKKKKTVQFGLQTVPLGRFFERTAVSASRNRADVVVRFAELLLSAGDLFAS